MNVQLSLDETYADVAPVRTDSGGKTALVGALHVMLHLNTSVNVDSKKQEQRSAMHL